MRRVLIAFLMTSALVFCEPITREAVEKRLASLDQSRLQLMADLNATNGAIQDCKYWLERLDAKPEVKPEVKPGPAAAKQEPKPAGKEWK